VKAIGHDCSDGDMERLDSSGHPSVCLWSWRIRMLSRLDDSHTKTNPLKWFLKWLDKSTNP